MKAVIIIENGCVTDTLADSKDCDIEVIDLDDQDINRREASLKTAEEYRKTLFSV